MWLYWENQPQGQSREYRGYYPLINRIPDEFQPIERYRDFFFDNSVKGARFRDLRVMQIEKQNGHYCKDKNWPLETKKYFLLIRRCWIHPDTDSVEEGDYSFDTTRSGCNNCASWAIRVTNEVMGNPEFLPLPQPTRIKTVIPAIWGRDSSLTTQTTDGDNH